MKKKQHGGPRKGAGPKPKFGTRMTRVNVMLDDETIAKLRKFGKGNLSEGIREAARLV